MSGVWVAQVGARCKPVCFATGRANGAELKVRVLAPLCLLLARLFLPFSAFSQEQQAPIQERAPKCTDLSGKLSVPCQVEHPEQEGTSKQGGTGNKSEKPKTKSSIESSLPKNVLLGQREFWTIPLRFRLNDVSWAIPFGITTGGLIASDTSIEKELPSSATTISRSHSISNYGIAAFGGVVGGTYLWGRITHNDHMKDTGWIAGEAAANSFFATYAIKLATGRQRPTEGNGRGDFFSGGQSFPSEHAAAAWSIATVLADRYPGIFPRLLAYGGASAITVARVTGRNHFASDAFVGSAVGWYFGRQAIRRHHAQEEGQPNWGTFSNVHESVNDPRMMGSPYLPLDSWVYPVFDRLAALGYVQSAFAGLRPWTRLECARLLSEALHQGDRDGLQQSVDADLHALRREFAIETARLAGSSNMDAEIDSVYIRATNISGVPLTDGFHFGQTIYNDYGRPYQEGFNLVSGVTARAVAGPFAIYVNGEYQHAPFAPAESSQVRDTIGTIDRDVGAPPPIPSSEINRLRLLDAYVAVNLSNWQLSFGQQSLWWGPGRGSALMFTNNAEPFPMVRLNRVSPGVLPSVVGRWLGPLRAEFVFGQLRGQRFVYQPPDYQVLTGSWTSFLKLQPYFHAEKFNLKPTRNLEIGVTLAAIFGAPGVPVTYLNFARTFHNFSTGPHNNGDRVTGFQFSYRLPGLRNWLTLYTDASAEDEPNPIVYPRRSAMNPGIYLSHVPKLPKMDFRAEGIYTDLPNLRGAGVWYTDQRFVNAYTNEGNILGSWVGREGRGVQTWTTYWLTPQRTVRFGYRYAAVSKGFVPDGGSLNDFFVNSEWLLKQDLSLKTLLQYESWYFPLLSLNRENNFTASFQLTWNVSRKARVHSKSSP